MVSAEQIVRFENADGQVIASFVTTNGVHPPVPWVGEVIALPAKANPSDLWGQPYAQSPYYSDYDNYRVRDVKMVYNRVIDAARGDMAIHVEYIWRVLVEPVKYGSGAPDPAAEGR
jgi:hypothetical protein